MNDFGGESEPLVTVLDVRRNASSDELFRNRYPNDRIQAGRKPAQLFLVLASVLVAIAVLRAYHQKVDASSMQQITAQLIRTNTDTTKATNPEDDNIQDVANRALQTLNESIKTVPKDECKVTVLITRHCNDYGVYAMEDADSGDKHCSFVGYERTEYFAEKFESHKAQTNEQVHRRWPLPSALYALLPEQATQIGGINYRQIEMLLPLAKRTHVSIQVVGTPEQVAESIHKKLQQDGDICGQVMVIAWKHRFIPNVAAALGCGPDQGCYESYPDEEFDQVVSLRCFGLKVNCSQY
jgi:uncharacterized membrane protein